MTKPHAFKYYRIDFRHRQELNKKTLKGLQKEVFRFLGDITICDINIKKQTKPQEWIEK